MLRTSCRALPRPDELFGALVINRLRDRVRTCQVHTHAMTYCD